MKYLVLPIAVVLMLLLGCTGQQDQQANGTRQPDGKEGAPAINNTGAMQKYNASLPNLSINNTATIGKLCLNEVVEADCRLRDRNSEQVFEADGTPTGETLHHETLLNHDNVTSNCTVAFNISYRHAPSKYVNYTAVLGPNELSEVFTVSTWTVDESAADAHASGTKVEKVCRPYPGN